MMTDHSVLIEQMRAQQQESQDSLGIGLAADLLELHDRTGISLDNWPNARRFVERAAGHPIQENGA